MKDKIFADFDKANELKDICESKYVNDRKFRLIIKVDETTILNADGVSELFAYNIIKMVASNIVPFDATYYYELYEVIDKKVGD